MAFPAKTDRQAIIAAARALLARDGPRAMSLRRVATSLKLAPNAIYRYFDDHAQLQTAVAADVAASLHSVLLRADSGRDPESAIRALAHAYLRFARDEPWLYEALIIPRPASGEDAVAPERLWHFVVEQVARICGRSKAPEAAVALWAFLHGMAALQSTNHFREEMPLTSFDFGLNAWLDAARTGSVAT